MEEQDRDWYEATVIDNSILGEAFPVRSVCAFRRCGDTDTKLFEIFNIKDTASVLSGDKAKTQLRSMRDRNKAVVRARDQGYVEWKYACLKDAEWTLASLKDKD